MRRNSDSASAAVTNIISNDTATLLFKSQELLNEQFKILKSDCQSKVCKRHGITCESSALDAYSEITGFPVDSRNTAQLTWHIPVDCRKLESVILEILNDHKHPDGVHSGNCQVFKSIYLTNVLSPYIVSDCRNKSSTEEVQEPSHQADAFTIIGRPDGISYHLDMTSDDHTQWRFEVRNLIVIKILFLKS